MARFTTGVTVVTYRDGDMNIRGATVNSFTSVSLEPALVLISLSRKANAAKALVDRPFAINVLRADQSDVAMQFAGRDGSAASIGWGDDSDPARPPTIAGAIAVISCIPWKCYDGGDHVLQIGEVTSATVHEGQPLVFADGKFMTPGIPLLDSPLVLNLDGAPALSWTGSAYRLHHVADIG